MPRGTTRVLADVTISDADVIDRLHPWVAQLAGAAARQRAMPFNEAEWQRWLKQVPDPTLQAVAAHPGELLAWLGLERPQVSRADLRRLAVAEPRSNLRLLVGVLVWGRGRKNQRMLPHMMATLAAPARNEVLAATGAAAAARDLAVAYAGWSLPGLRAPFFTKWLWAAGLRSGHHRNVPLVLDSRVSSSLNRGLGWNSRIAAQSLRLPRRYATYCDAMTRWADGLSDHDLVITAEDLECGLFHADGVLERLETLPTQQAA